MVHREERGSARSNAFRIQALTTGRSNASKIKALARDIKTAGRTGECPAVYDALH